jgi:hypothetical protein
MKPEMKILIAIALANLLSVGAAFTQGSTQGPVKVNPPASVTDKAKSPAPSADAKKGASIGKEKVKAKTANGTDDTDSIWVEQLDIDGDGDVEETNLLWDDEDKVLYLYADGTFTCANGGTGEGGMLIPLYGDGNTYKKPVGSGWYAVGLDKSECAAETAGIYGCKFDAKGNATACGAARIDASNDDITIVAVSG